MKLERGQMAVVTGASGGLGEQFSRQLAGGGLNLILVARSVDKLEALAVELRAAHRIGVEVAPAEMNKAACVKMVGGYALTPFEIRSRLGNA
ncbi:SDR family NAD(P)-dependent oxidoreductase [Lichenifustis flavocetrariae]|uniref:SDR family NAD(P)-dependent oxidoreductase n=1 Tax=Lichenifustis flavocetrariae TaxID=2949735 RepID=A0AA42CMX6_9HYPH|nr:SDR family NAD(P)-dependent oxidoreductase [Lichenifustis flavocetrariae]MCW6512061.1 SDR family NAD(P)-dependent oxidoreductase [Lichenifustis flavocetrariae]